MAAGTAPADAPWGTTWATWRGRLVFLVSLVACLAALAGQARFLRWNETRSGPVLDDPVLALFEPVDLSVPTFAVIYATLALALVVLGPRPRRLGLALRAYALTAAARVLLMWLVPLDPPPRIIPLADPLVEAAAADTTLVRDLFFSGHTATLCLLALVLPRGWVRHLTWAAMAAVATFTALQHSHYVVDVLAAPLVAWACFRLALRLGAAETGTRLPA